MLRVELIKHPVPLQQRKGTVEDTYKVCV